MFLPVYAALIVAFVFYLAIPLAGAFALRGRWRRFRVRFEKLRTAPVLRYGDVARAATRGDCEVGHYRLFGRVEALEGNDRLWLRGEGVSALVDFSRAPLYALKTGDDRRGVVERLPWRSVTSLAEGTRMLAAGLLVLEGGNPVFVDAPGELLVAVSYDCDDRGIASKVIAGARATNEYWTPLSGVSLALGLATMSALLLSFGGRSSLSTVRAMAFLVGILPILPLLPPGLFFFLLYRRLWRRALSLRTSRDLFRVLASRLGAEEEKNAEDEASNGWRGACRPLLAGEAAPPDALVLDVPPGVEDLGEWLLFAAEGTGDPMDESIVSPGDPKLLAQAAERSASAAALGSGAAIGFALLLNYALGFALWRLLL